MRVAGSMRSGSAATPESRTATVTPFPVVWFDQTLSAFTTRAYTAENDAWAVGVGVGVGVGIASGSGVGVAGGSVGGGSMLRAAAALGGESAGTIVAS